MAMAKALSALCRTARPLALALCAWIAPAKFAAAQQQAFPAGQPSVAFYYGIQPPISALEQFDIAVVDPDAKFSPLDERASHTKWYAYVSVGEVHPNRSYYKAIPKKWRPAVNQDWASDVVDQSVPQWPAFFVDHVIAPLWQKGYRGFFLDTLDSFQRIAHTDAARAAQQAGLVRVIRLIKARYPKAQLIFNRGFEIMPEVHDNVQMVAFESLFRGWNASTQKYVEVPQADRAWLLGQVDGINSKYKIPIIAIDYCDPADSNCQKETVGEILRNGFIPYVTDGGLSTVGVGASVLSNTTGN